MNQRAGVAILMLSGLICAVGTDKTVHAQIHPAVDATWVLAHVDVETTGLVAGYHEMVDIGVAYTDLDGKILKTWYRKMMPQHLDRVTEGAVAINGFDPEIWKKEGALSQLQALEEMLAFEKQHFAGRKILRVAYNCSFDSAFLDHWFRAQNGEWRNLYSYGFLDIPSMAWALGYRDLRSQPLTRTLKVQDEPHTPLEHTGITGAEVNVRIYKALLAERGARGKGTRPGSGRR